MRTITIDIIDEKALRLLQDLEALQLIRLRNDSLNDGADRINWSKYKGAMSPQSKQEVDQQLEELRNEWD